MDASPGLERLQAYSKLKPVDCEEDTVGGPGTKVQHAVGNLGLGLRSREPWKRKSSAGAYTRQKL